MALFHVDLNISGHLSTTVEANSAEKAIQLVREDFFTRRHMGVSLEDDNGSYIWFEPEGEDHAATEIDAEDDTVDRFLNRIEDAHPAVDQ